MVNTTMALVGNPNSGKTTLFNALTGSNQRVGNWPGVTVERKEGRLRGASTVMIQDLPGVYSLSPYSAEEVVTRDYLVEHNPELVVDVVDATNLERNLYLTMQLMETGIPVTIALNMVDLLAKQGQRTINSKKLAYLLGIPVYPVSALHNKGIGHLSTYLTDPHSNRYNVPEYDSRLEAAIQMISQQLRGLVPDVRLRWYSIKFFERDEDIEARIALTMAKRTEIDATIRTAERLFDDTADSIVVNARYDYIAKIVAMACVDSDDFTMTASDRIDRIVTNRWLALPIFFLVMWLVYYLAIETVGTLGSDWVNDVLFGQWVPGAVTNLFNYWHVAPWLTSLVVEGIIGGVGAVLGFLPQVAVLFLCMGILEDCGYMARIAFVMDRIFHRFNLSGKAFIPMLISTGCGVPGIMATRTIESTRERRMTIMLTTFMPCSAKLTVIALVAGVFFPNNSLIAPSAYLLGIMAVILSGIFLKKTALFRGTATPFVMELPAYHLPHLGNTWRAVWTRCYAFAHKAGTIIFLSCVGIWFLSNFNFGLQMVDQNHSILKTLGTAVAPIFAPLGFGDWHSTVAVLTGLIAKENCVSTLHVTFGGSNAHFTQMLQTSYTPMAGYAFMAFNLLCAPCFAAIGTMYKEFGDTGWTLRAVGYQTAIAYGVALVINQAALLVQGQANIYGIGAMVAVLLLTAYGLVLKRDVQPETGIMSADTI